MFFHFVQHFLHAEVFLIPCFIFIPVPKIKVLLNTVRENLYSSLKEDILSVFYFDLSRIKYMYHYSVLKNLKKYQIAYKKTL